MRKLLTILLSTALFSNYVQAQNYFAPNTPAGNTGNANTFVGPTAGQNNTSGGLNTYVGFAAGRDIAPGGGNNNCFMGYASGLNNTGSDNTFIGVNTGRSAVNTTNNSANSVFIGSYAGYAPLLAGAGSQLSNGTLIGSKTQALGNLTNATAIGANAVVSASNSIVLGSINGTNGATVSTNVGIGVTAPRTALEINGSAIIGAGITSLPAGYNLYVANGVISEKVTIAAKNTTAWADFVFEKNYKLRPLAEVENFIQQNGHLPEVPSTQEVQANGMNLAENDAKLLQKIEELTLYVIAQDKKIKLLEKRIVKRKH
jgi:trimeric autotransporter adhesin